MTRRSVFAPLLVAAVLCGCGKKEEEAPPAPPPVAETPEAPAAAPDAPAAAPEAAPAPKNWDEYVAKIVRLRAGPMTDEKREEALALQDELVAASVSDPKAREAYQNLSRILTGR